MDNLSPLILTLLLIIVVPSASSTQTSVPTRNDLISKTCSRTPFSQLCVSTLRSHPRSSRANLKGLSLILVRAAQSEAAVALRTINRLRAASDPRFRIPLSKCGGVYRKILRDHIPKALHALSSRGDPKAAADGVSRSAAGAQECQRILIGIKNPPQVLIRVGRVLADLFAIIASIIKSLMGGIRRRHGPF
ncbi:hypothetical protein U1Q18_015864 [Sarracenia purpurea var. burkii]